MVKRLVASSPAWLRRLFFGASVGAMANAAAQLGTFLFGIYLARTLGVAGFGLWAIVYTTLLTATALSSLSINVSAARFASALTAGVSGDAWGRLRAVALISTGLAGVVSAALFVAAGTLADHALATPEAARLLRWGCLFVLAGSMANLWSGIVAGREAYGRLLVNNLLGTLLLLGLGVPAAQVWGLEGGIVALAISAGAVLLLNRRTALRLLPDLATSFRSGRDGIPWRSVIELVGPSALSGLLTTAALWACQMVLARSPGGTDEVGLFAAANGLRALAMLALTFITSAALIILSAEQARLPHGELRRLTIRIQLLVTVAALAASVAFALAGPALLGLYGRQFAAAEPIIVVLALSVFAEALGAVFYNDLMLRRALVSNLWLAVLPREATRLALTIAFIDHGAITLAWAFCGSAVLFAAVTGLQSLRAARRDAAVSSSLADAR